MTQSTELVLSVVVPLHNESAALQSFHKSLKACLETSVSGQYEIIYCDDGSTDNTSEMVRKLHHSDPSVKLLSLSRNFGKESALAAGIGVAQGRAIIMIDGDGQHPVELIPAFLNAWKRGAQVVIGVRTSNSGEGWFKRIGSSLFHRLFNSLTTQRLVPGSTDFRLIDRQVQQAFLQLHETDRITRGLIDWLGFDRVLVPFKAKAREHGSAGYSRRKLLVLAANSFVSLTSVPLYLFGGLGLVITTAALLLGSAVGIEQLILGDPWHWKFTGTAMLSILLLFLVGIVLLSQGMLSLYVSHIHNQSKQRPLYIVDRQASVGVELSGSKRES